MELGPWRNGGRKQWTMPEIERLRAAYAATPSPVDIWRSGAFPDRSLAAIRARLQKSRIVRPAPYGIEGRRMVGVNLGLEHRRWLARFGRRGASAAVRKLIDAAMGETP